ncbi:LysR family transcriptional regulator [Kitasatospora aburaviensis]
MASEVNLAQLRALIAVADAGGFGVAAAELGISQSAVSHAVAALERALGAPVLLRTSPARPTPLGEQILPHARAAVASAAAVSAIATRHSGGLTGTVRLAAPTTVCQGLLPALLQDWRAAHPGSPSGSSRGGRRAAGLAGGRHGGRRRAGGRRPRAAGSGRARRGLDARAAAPRPPAGR